MKFTVKKGDESSIRKVWSDDKKVCYGIVGTVRDLLAAKVFDYCDYSPETWAFVPFPETNQKVWFGKTREAACANIEGETEN